MPARIFEWDMKFNQYRSPLDAFHGVRLKAR